MHTIIHFFPEKNRKKISVPTFLKLLDSLPENTIFFIWPKDFSIWFNTINLA